jgi:hypothetical protein
MLLFASRHTGFTDFAPTTTGDDVMIPDGDDSCLPPLIHLLMQ